MADDQILSVEGVTGEEIGGRMPCVFVPPQILDRLEVEHPSVIEVEPIGHPEWTVKAFLHLPTKRDLSGSSCVLSEALAEAFDQEPGQVKIRPGDVQAAKTVKVGKPISIQHSLSGLGVSDDEVKELEDQAVAELRKQDDPVYVGYTEKLDADTGNGATVYAEVEEVVPATVALITEDTDILVRGRDF